LSFNLDLENWRIKMYTKLFRLVMLLLVASMLVVSCAPQAPVEEVPVVEEVTEPEVVAPEPEVVEPEPEIEEPEPEAEVTYPPAPEFIELGSSISLTGGFSGLGTLILPGYQIAVEHINADGGVFVAEYNTKIPLRLTYYDDESDPTGTVSKMETLFSDLDLTAYLGGGGSSMHAAGIPIAEKNQVPYFGVAFALYQIHQQGYEFLFSPFPKSPAQAKDVFVILNDAIAEGERPTKVAMFMYNDDWGKEWGTLARQYADESGYEIVVYEENAVGVNDWTDAILKAQAAGAQTLISMPIFPDGSGMFKTMAELGWTPEYSLIIRAPEGVYWGNDLGAIAIM
jgi:branched-chain amino acid transport system substrate-binding protein